MPNDWIRQAPEWAIQVGVAGRLFVYVAIALLLLSAALALPKRPQQRSASRSSFVAGVACILVVFALHVLLLMTRQYEYQYVFNNTRNELSNIYRFSAAWASQEGSFLLWTLTSAFVAMIVARLTADHRPMYTVVCAIALSAMLGIVAYESPFALVEVGKEDMHLLPSGVTVPLVANGRGLNPTLENYWMAIHPWVIFIGFGSLLSLFAWTFSVAISKDWNSWLARVRPLGVFCLTMLGTGLVMGGLWAYETLGWGGFWAWDPVENVSLVPFLGCIAFSHSLYVSLRRGVWQKLTIILGALPLLWFVYGTFLTRSGVLANVSVHSFAKMNDGAHGLLMGLVIATLLSSIFVSIWVSRKRLPEGTRKPSGDRLVGIGFGIATVYGIAMMAAIGMSVPFFSGLMGRFDAEGKARVIEETVYNQVITYPFIPVMLLLAVVPFLGWTKTQRRRVTDIASILVSSVLFTSGVAWYLRSQGLFVEKTNFQLILSLVLLFLCVTAIIANLWRLLERGTHHSGRWAPFLMHSGAAILLLGLITSRTFEKHAQSAVSVTSPARVSAGPAAFLLKLNRTPSDDQWVERENRLDIEMVNLRRDQQVLPAQVSHYFKIDEFGGEPMMVTRPAIFSSPLYDLYLSVNAPVFEVAEPITLKVGETKTMQNIQITYLENTRYGEAGQTGTKFGAKLKVVYDAKTFNVEPHMELTPGAGATQHRARIGDEFFAELISLDAATHDAKISIQFTEPFLPIELFYKPFTLFVWLGAGIMALGGILTMIQVRPKEKFAA